MRNYEIINKIKKSQYDRKTRSSPKNLRVEERELIIFFNPLVMEAL